MAANPRSSAIYGREVHRVKKGQTPGFPRFKGKGRYHSFTYAQSGFSINKDGKLILSKVGTIKLVLHRPLEGKVKTCTVKRMPTGKWFVLFSCEVEPQPLYPNPEIVGIDLGLKNFLAMSTGELIPNPHFFKQEEKELAKVQRKLSLAAKGTKERFRRKKVVARVYERISNKRENLAHQLSFFLVLLFGIIIFEELQIDKMITNEKFSKGIADVAWQQLIDFTSYKAGNAGRTVILVEPRNTSQQCSQCLVLVYKDLSQRTHKCPSCGLKIDRDINAALNIKRLGLQALGLKPLEAPANS